MCQVNATEIMACRECGATLYGYNSGHKCKVYVPFEKWDADLQADAKRLREKHAANPEGRGLWRTMEEAVVSVAGWAEWKRRYAWGDEFRHSKGRPK